MRDASNVMSRTDILAVTVQPATSSAKRVNQGVESILGSRERRLRCAAERELNIFLRRPMTGTDPAKSTKCISHKPTATRGRGGCVARAGLAIVKFP
jgi:hypothetical protein